MNNLPSPISPMMRGMLDGAIHEHPATSAITLNFKDPNYSPERGGYHPIEIRLECRKGCWRLAYVTDFAYYGPPGFAELEKEIDFDFNAGVGYLPWMGEQPLARLKALYQCWEANFLTYCQMEVYTLNVTMEM